MRFDTMYNKLTITAQKYDFQISEVITIWDDYTNKEMNWCSKHSSKEDLAIKINNVNLYDFCRENSLEKVNRYFKFKNYMRNK